MNIKLVNPYNATFTGSPEYAIVQYCNAKVN